MMRAVEVLLRRNAHELGFDFGGRFAVGEAGAVGDAEDVCIHGDCAFAEDFHQHDVGSFAADAGEGLQRLAIVRDFALVLIDQGL